MNSPRGQREPGREITQPSLHLLAEYSTAWRELRFRAKQNKSEITCCLETLFHKHMIFVMKTLIDTYPTNLRPYPLSTILKGLRLLYLTPKWDNVAKTS